MPEKKDSAIADKNEICEYLTAFMRDEENSENTRISAAKELVKLVGYAPAGECAESPADLISDDRFR